MEEWIKKSDAIEAIKDNSFALGDDYMEINGYGAIDDIRALPSADRPRGEWIDTTSGEHWKCSACGYRAPFWFNEENSCEWSLDMSEWLSDFCPSCGARMKGADDDD